MEDGNKSWTERILWVCDSGNGSTSTIVSVKTP